MRGDFPDDTFTQNDVENELDRAGLKHYDKGRYLLAQCPTHEDQHPSVQIYKDDWFVNCHATCGRFHITKAFPTLRETKESGPRTPGVRASLSQRNVKAQEVKYKTFDLLPFWRDLPLIPRDHVFKGIPLEILDDLGWRYDEAKNSYFIPYFSASKGSIPFAQWRHLQGERRFTFLKDAKPTCYGTWNLDNPKLFIVEGTSDAAVLDFAAVPWIALPSAASGELMRSMANYCKENGIQLVYAGDNDAAGDKLREALDEVSTYRVKQVPPKYKDWGEFLEAEGVEVVSDYAMEELFPKKLQASITPEVTASEPEEPSEALKNVQQVFPGATELEIVDDGQESRKERINVPSSLLF